MSLRPARAFVATFLLLTLGLWSGHQVALAAYGAGQSPYAGLDTFARALTQIQDHYVEEASTEYLVHSAIAGMTEALDEQSMFFDPDTYAALRADTEGVSGIGVLVVPSPKGGLLIEEVIQGGPALTAGLRAGDRVLAVDDQPLEGLTLEQAVGLIKGPRGTEARLSILRAGEQEPQELKVVRDEVFSPTVHGELADGGLAYVRIDQFRRRAGQEFVDTLSELRTENQGPLTGLVIDLRQNPGGLLDEAVVVVDRFVDEGMIVETRGRSGQGSDERHDASPEGTERDLPLVVLVDGRSASASEIVAGALQDHGRAAVVGQPTWGKGSVQSYFEYEDHSALKLTIASYYLPSGRRLVRGEGIQPDRVVANPSPDPRLEIQDHVSGLNLEPQEQQELIAMVRALPGPPATASAPDFRGSLQLRMSRDAQLKAAFDQLSAG